MRGIKKKVLEDFRSQMNEIYESNKIKLENINEEIASLERISIYLKLSRKTYNICVIKDQDLGNLEIQQKTCGKKEKTISDIKKQTQLFHGISSNGILNCSTDSELRRLG